MSEPSTTIQDEERVPPAEVGWRVNDLEGPSNVVHARVGDAVLRSARDGIRRGLKPEDVIRLIRTDHDVRLNLGELRLLLASRPLSE